MNDVIRLHLFNSIELLEFFVREAKTIIDSNELKILKNKLEGPMDMGNIDYILGLLNQAYQIAVNNDQLKDWVNIIYNKMWFIEMMRKKRRLNISFGVSIGGLALLALGLLLIQIL